MDATEPRFTIRLASPDMGADEVEAVREVLASGTLTNGPATRSFEERFAERHATSHAVAFANGTVALTAMYAGLGIGPGDEVIVPSMTFISSATSVLHAGAHPVFCDIDPDTFNLNPEDVARRITPRTKAILAVHYGGQPADLDELATIAEDAGAYLLEDAAEAHGAAYRGRPVGSVGHAGMFSFTPTKNITTGEGGMVTTDDAELAERLRLLRNHGQTDVYRHDLLGYNWRITEMQAAIGRVQLDKLDGILARKREHARWMHARLSGIDAITPPATRADREHAYMLYTLKVAGGRDRVVDALHNEGIEARIYFPPAHRQPVFAGYEADLPVTDEVAAEILSIPFHAKLEASDLETIASALERALT